MSFSSEVKEELSRYTDSARHCQIAELAAILGMNGHVQKNPEGKWSLVFQSENEVVVRKCFTLLKKTFNIEREIRIRPHMSLNKGNVYLICLENPAETRKVLQGIKAIGLDGNISSQSVRVDPIVYQKNCCKRAFIRGSFLASGSISDPEKFYHFEIVCPSSEKAEQLQEILRRYYTALCDRRMGAAGDELVNKLELVMQQAHVDVSIRPVVAAAAQVAEATGKPAGAIELPDGEVVTGKTTDLMGASSSTLLNALKCLAGIGHEHHLISREAIEPIQTVKVKHLGSANPRLHSDEILIALAISATTNPLAKQALDQLSALRGCEAHSSVILSPVDSHTYSRLGLRLTCEPQYETNKLYHK